MTREQQLNYRTQVAVANIMLEENIGRRMDGPVGDVREWKSRMESRG